MRYKAYPPELDQQILRNILVFLAWPRPEIASVVANLVSSS